MGGFKSLGKSLGKAVKNIGKSLKKAAPVLVPLIITAATGGFGGAIAGKMGTVGKLISGAIGKVGTLGGVIKSGPVQNGLLKGMDVGGAITGAVQKAIPTLITRAIEGKPKSAQQETAALMAASPGSGFDPVMMKSYSDLLAGELKNPQKISVPNSGGYTQNPMVYGAPVSFAPPTEQTPGSSPASTPTTPDSSAIPQDQNRMVFSGPMAPVAPMQGNVLTGGSIGGVSAPVAPKKNRAFLVRGRAQA